MKNLPYQLLKDREAFWDDLKCSRIFWSDLLGMILFIVGVCAVYGAVLAGWRSPLLSCYVAIKLPMLFLGTIAVVAVFNWMIASIMGAGLSFKNTLFVVFASMTLGCWILLGLIPVALLFLVSGVSTVGTQSELRYAHNAMLVAHIIILALAGFQGNASLFKGLRNIVNPRCPAKKLFVIWLLLFAFVGCQLSWILRPFLGSPFFPVEFMRENCLDRNFYEFVFGEVIPYLLRGGR